MASTATDDAGAHSAPGEDKRTDAASSSTANKNSTTLPPQSDAQAQLKAALEVERNLRDIIIALAAVLQLRRQSYNAGTGGRGGPNGAGAGAGQGGSEQAASIVPLPSPYPRPAAFQSRPVGVHGARIGGAGIASSSNVGAQNGNGPNGLNAASNVHAVGGVDGRGARAGAAFAREGVDLVMSAHVRRLASLCQSFLGKTNRLRDWLIQVITAVDNELEVQFKLAPAPSPPALTAAELVEAITSSAPLLMDSPVVAVPTSSTAMQTSSPVASIGTGAVVTPAPAREIIDLAADDDDDELPLGQLRDRSKPSPSKPSASGTSGGRADHAGEGAGTPSSISTPGAAAAMASKKRKRTSSASVGADMPSSLSSKMPMPARDDIVDLTMDSPSPSPATPSASSKKTPKLGADAVKTAGGGASVEAVPSSTSPGGSSVLFAGGGVGDTPASLSGLGEAVTSSAPAPVDASLPASTATAATTTTTAPTSTTAAPGGDLFSMTQPELDLSALLAADEGAGGAKGGDDGKTGSAASGEGAKGGAASSTLPVSCSASTTAVTATAPAPTSTATEASTTSTTTTTSNPLLPGLSFDFGTASSGAGLDMSAYLDASQYMNLDSDAMAALDSMDFSGIDFGSFGTGEGDAGGDQAQREAADTAEAGATRESVPTSSTALRRTRSHPPIRPLGTARSRSKTPTGSALPTPSSPPVPASTSSASIGTSTDAVADRRHLSPIRGRDPRPLWHPFPSPTHSPISSRPHTPTRTATPTATATGGASSSSSYGMTGPAPDSAQQAGPSSSQGGMAQQHTHAHDAPETEAEAEARMAHERDEERKHFESVLKAFDSYLPMMLAANENRRRSFKSLPPHHRMLLDDLGPVLPAPVLDGSPVPNHTPKSNQQAHDKGDDAQRTMIMTGKGVRARLDEMDDRIRRNADVLGKIVADSRLFLRAAGQYMAPSESMESESQLRTEAGGAGGVGAGAEVEIEAETGLGSESSSGESSSREGGVAASSGRAPTGEAPHMPMSSDGPLALGPSTARLDAGLDVVAGLSTSSGGGTSTSTGPSNSTSADPGPEPGPSGSGAAERRARRKRLAERRQREREAEQSAHHLEKVRSTIKQFARDWSDEGREEREAAYNPILDAVEARFGHLTPAQKSELHILVPGAGLGRLAWEFARRGYSCQGNEFSFYMLLASHFVLNESRAVGEHVLYPYVHSASNWRTAGDLLQAVRVPDVLPSDLPAGVDFSMVAGEFVEVYGRPSERERWQCVATSFFIDTARNLVDYLETINGALALGGYWVNAGPLLWHFENGPGELSIELTLEEVLDLVVRMGFEMEEERRLSAQMYTGAPRAMLSYVYYPHFFVARKVRRL